MTNIAGRICHVVDRLIDHGGYRVHGAALGAIHAGIAPSELGLPHGEFVATLVPRLLPEIRPAWAAAILGAAGCGGMSTWVDPHSVRVGVRGPDDLLRSEQLLRVVEEKGAPTPEHRARHAADCQAAPGVEATQGTVYPCGCWARAPFRDAIRDAVAAGMDPLWLAADNAALPAGWQYAPAEKFVDLLAATATRFGDLGELAVRGARFGLLGGIGAATPLGGALCEADIRALAEEARAANRRAPGRDVVDAETISKLTGLEAENCHDEHSVDNIHVHPADGPLIGVCGLVRGGHFSAYRYGFEPADLARLIKRIPVNGSPGETMARVTLLDGKRPSAAADTAAAVAAFVAEAAA